jgi:hypothetical protein
MTDSSEGEKILGMENTVVNLHLAAGPTVDRKAEISPPSVALALLSVSRASSNAKLSFSCATTDAIVGL